LVLGRSPVTRRTGIDPDSPNKQQKTSSKSPTHAHTHAPSHQTVREGCPHPSQGGNNLLERHEGYESSSVQGSFHAGFDGLYEWIVLRARGQFQKQQERHAAAPGVSRRRRNRRTTINVEKQNVAIRRLSFVVGGELSSFLSSFRRPSSVLPTSDTGLGRVPPGSPPPDKRQDPIFANQRIAFYRSQCCYGGTDALLLRTAKQASDIKATTVSCPRL
jgi:hypothetical protein